MKILVVDDEALPRQSLVRKIHDLRPEAAVKDEGDPHAALETIHAWHPDVLLLDISMPGLSGFDLLAHVRPVDRTFALVFCTAHGEHALRAFEERAVDYLLKPVDPARLAAALDRVAVKPLPLAGHYLARLAVRTRKGVAVVPVGAVTHATSEAHETVVYTADAEYITDLSLGDLEAGLDPAVFFRCHRSHLVRLDAVSALTNDGDAVLGAVRIPVARRRRGELLAALSGKMKT